MAEPRVFVWRLVLLEQAKARLMRSDAALQPALDRLIAQWTTALPAEKIVSTLQAAGVPAGVVQNAGDVAHDPQFLSREFFLPRLNPQHGV